MNTQDVSRTDTQTDSASVVSSAPSQPHTHSAQGTQGTQPKRDWVQQFLQKSLKQFQTDENKKWFQVFVLDPILTHVLERLFPYIVIFTVLFVILTGMITLTLVLVFLRLPSFHVAVRK